MVVASYVSGSLHRRSWPAGATTAISMTLISVGVTQCANIFGFPVVISHAARSADLSNSRARRVPVLHRKGWIG